LPQEVTHANKMPLPSREDVEAYDDSTKPTPEELLASQRAAYEFWHFQQQQQMQYEQQIRTAPFQPQFDIRAPFQQLPTPGNPAESDA